MSRTRLCRYECGTELGDFDEQQNKYRELTGTLHTKERCQSIKSQAVTTTKRPEPVVLVNESQQKLTVEERLARLEAFFFKGDKK